MEDKRFKHIKTHPKFRNIRKKDQKVKIDKRFESMFKDKFNTKYIIDKRGRIVNQKSSADLRRYYHLSSEESSSEEEDISRNGDQNEETGKLVNAPSKSNDELSVKVESDKKVSDVVEKKLRNLNVDYARGETNLFSESSSDEEESDDDVSDVENAIDHKWGEPDGDAQRTDEATYRIAVCGMDWDRIKAVDLMVLFNSFVPPGGMIKSLTIYPSEFGKQRMKEEELKGPIELVQPILENEKEENEEGSNYHMEKLRKYQLNRLKYYYAVVDCDSVTTANKIYTECDGMEYESSATKIDLRFIPDDMSFDDEPKEVCDKLPDMGEYKPRFFTTTALQQAKVDLTWDETNPDRIEITQKLSSGKIEGISKADLQKYLASSSDEESETDQNKCDLGEEEEDKVTADKYRALIDEINTKEKERKNNNFEMEISWDVNLKNKAEQAVKKTIEKKEAKTPFEKYLDKRNEKRKEKRQAKNKANAEDEQESDIPFDIDMNDPYFTEEFNNPEFKKKRKEKKPENIKSDFKDVEAELKFLLTDENNTKQHFNLKKIQERDNESKSKKKRNKNNIEEMHDDFEINEKDNRFTALYTSHHFNIDPTDPHFKKTKGMEKIINEKIKRRNEEEESSVIKKPKMEQKKNTELNTLVKSVKRKAEALTNKKNCK